MAALDALLALVVPPACPACRAPVAGAAARLCPSCSRALPWLRGGCPRCALPAHRGRACPAAAAPWARAWAPLAYEGVARDLVGALKFRAALPVADLMAAQLAANLPAALAASRSAVVPVPAHRGRRRARGHDPAGRLAAAFARRLDAPLAACLRRMDGASRQVGTGRAARRAPGRLRIEATRSPPSHVLLVDDVHTTGATLRAAAHALLAAGAEEVTAISYARTL